MTFPPGTPPAIQSRENATVKRMARLLDSVRERSALGLVPLEGCHLIGACLDAPMFGPDSIMQVLVSEAALQHPEVSTMLLRVPADRIVVVARTAFSKLGAEEGANAVIAAMLKPAVDVAPRASGLRLCLDGVQDPGNVGTLIRTAAAAGATAVVLGRGCADAWSPKTLRAGMGGQFRVAIEIEVDLAQWLAAESGRVVAADAQGERTVFETDLTGDIAIVLGSEGQGLSEPVRHRVCEFVRIPMVAGIESLNVAAAGAILCFERVRQAAAPTGSP